MSILSAGNFLGFLFFGPAGEAQGVADGFGFGRNFLRFLDLRDASEVAGVEPEGGLLVLHVNIPC